MHYTRSHFARIVFFLSLFSSVPLDIAFAQVEAPTDKFIFDEDSERRQEREKKQRENIIKPKKSQEDSNVDFEAPNVEYLQEENVLKGSGGVLVSGDNLQLEAEEGSINLTTKDGEFSGDVLLSTPDGIIEADEIDFNIDYETGEFRNSQFSLEEGAFRVSAENAKKLSEKQYELKNCLLSTCNCEDGSRPWKISGDDVDITRNGYAHSYGTTISFQNVPFVYAPWFAFPIKEERASGLLVPQAGFGNQDGAQFRQPIFAVIDDHSDILFEPFIATRSRVGTALEYRKAFSARSTVHGRLLYSNESQRDGDLRGTIIDGIFDPDIDEERFAGFYRQSWRNEASSDVPLSFIADINLVSDNLILRELDEPEIGNRQSRFIQSDAILRASLGDYVSASLETEYNQALLTDQDLIFHRLPELRVDALRSFRPFGFHPLGLKLSTKTEIQATSFARDTGFDGFRYDIRPSVKIPLHYKNYVNAEIETGIRQTFYDLRNTLDPRTSEMLDDTNERTLFDGSLEVNTAVERVFELPEESWIKDITALGSEAGQYELQRLKHTVEPRLVFQYVPDTTQDELPVFDALDRIREKSLITMNLKTSLYGSFKARGSLPPEQIEELTPELERFSQVRDQQFLSDLDNLYGTEEVFSGQNIRRGRNLVRELASLRFIQSYDYTEDVEDNDPLRDAYSDLGTHLTLHPTPQFAIRLEDNFNFEDKELSSYGVSTHFRSDRGDILRARYTFIDSTDTRSGLSRIEGNVQIPITDQLQVGYYAMYDEDESEVIQQRGAFRLRSSCNCWHMDFGVTEQINPDRRRFLFSFTLRGLGDLTEEIGFRDDEENT